MIALLTGAVGTTYTITGTVSFYDGGTTLLGMAAISSNTAILPAITLSASVVHTITAVYSGDTSYILSTSAPLILEPVLLPVTVTLTASTPVLAPGQSATLTATVTPVNTPVITAEQHPMGTVLFYAGTTLLVLCFIAND
jgi:Bacterial Ig-like domain (group 3)